MPRRLFQILNVACSRNSLPEAVVLEAGENSRGSDTCLHLLGLGGAGDRRARLAPGQLDPRRSQVCEGKG